MIGLLVRGERNSRWVSQRQGGVSAQEESDGNAAARTRSDADPSVQGQQGLQPANDSLTLQLEFEDLNSS